MEKFLGFFSNKGLAEAGAFLVTGTVDPGLEDLAALAAALAAGLEGAALGAAAGFAWAAGLL